MQAGYSASKHQSIGRNVGIVWAASADFSSATIRARAVRGDLWRNLPMRDQVIKALA